MRPIIQEIETSCSPESLVGQSRSHAGVVLLRSAGFEFQQARYSFVAAQPFLTLRAFGSRCELTMDGQVTERFGNPWHVLDEWLARYELLDEVDLPFPLGGAFGYWGYDLKNFVEPRLPSRAINDLELPDCHVGFYHSLVAFDHRLGKTWIIATGLGPDGTRSESRMRQQAEFWKQQLQSIESVSDITVSSGTSGNAPVTSTFTRAGYLAAVERALNYIQHGHIYQVNLAQRLCAPFIGDGWDFSQRLSAVSPAPFSAYLDCSEFQIASSSPELFLRISGSHIVTRPIKGTRPRDADPTRDAQLSYELQTSAKEMSELVMITDLLRNDLGRVCQYGSVQVPDLARLERYPQVQHLVSTVEGQLKSNVTHLAALAACFPGGSITGAPKIRAMEIIDEIEPVSRGPYTGCLGYLGFNRESQLSISIRTALLKDHAAYFHVGAGIVADSIPEAEYDETIAKARGFLAALRTVPLQEYSPAEKG